MHAITDFVAAIAQSPLSLVVLALLLVIDGFFPLVPGETSVVALATLGAAGLGQPAWLVLVVAIAATVVGDGIAFAIGRRVGLDRWAWMRRPRIRQALAWAADGIHARPMTVFISAKFVPFARVAVTMTAGASPISVSRYLPISILASTIYTGYHVAVATVAGSLFAETPLLGVVVSLGLILVIGGLIELGRARHRRAGLRRSASAVRTGRR